MALERALPDAAFDDFLVRLTQGVTVGRALRAKILSSPHSP